MPSTLTNVTGRRVIIVEWGKRDTANSWAATWDPDSGGGETFGGVKLSADGSEPATHTACNTAATNAMLDAIQDASSNVPFVGVYELQEGETPTELWGRALALEGLSIIEPDTT